MSEICVSAAKAESKKQYSRPELVKHGAVETLTQWGSGNFGCSQGIILQPNPA